MNDILKQIIHNEKIGYVCVSSLDTPIILDTNDYFLKLFNLKKEQILNFSLNEIKKLTKYQLVKRNKKDVFIIINDKRFTLKTIEIDKGYAIILKHEEFKEKYDLVLKNMTNIIIHIDFERNVRYNSNFSHYKENELLKKDITLFISQEKFVYGINEMILNKTNPFFKKVIEFEDIDYDGIMVIYEYELRFYLEDNLPKGIICIGNDVTEEKLVKRSLKDSEQQLRLIFDSTVEGIFGMDLNATCTFCNESSIRILNYERQSDLLGENMCKIVYQSDNQKCIFNDIIKKQRNDYHFECIFKKQNGVMFNADCHSFPQYINGQITGYLISFSDMTEKMEVESELKESIRSKSILLSNLPGMAYRAKFDYEHTMTFVSSGCINLTGYYEESLINNNDLAFGDLVINEYREPLWNAWVHAISNKKPFDGEYKIKCADGKEKWVLERGQAIYKNNNEVEALEGLIIDITELKQTQDAISYLSYHDALTGLFNRLYFEMEKGMNDLEENLPISIIMGDINGLKLINDSFGHDIGDKLIIQTAHTLNRACREHDTLARIGGDEFAILLPKTTNEEAEQIILDIKKYGNEYNKNNPKSSVIINISLGCATKKKMKESITLIQKDAEDSMYKRKLLERSSSHSAIVNSIRTSLFGKCNETEEHTERMKKHALKMAELLNLTQNEKDDLALLATLHDVGKVGISDQILSKPDKLTEVEWEEVKKHSGIGYRIAMASSELVPIAKYIQSHHERWDGLGYPDGLKEKAIPLLSRIIFICDAFDVMTNDRPYKLKISKMEAIEELKKNAGTQFDPSLVKIFIKIILEDE